MMKGYILQLDALTAEGGEGINAEDVLRGNLISQLNEHTEVPHVVGEVALRFGFVGPEERTSFEDFIGNIYGNVQDTLRTFEPDEEGIARVTPLTIGLARLRDGAWDFHNGMYDPLMKQAEVFGHWLGHIADNVVNLTVVPEEQAEAPAETEPVEAQAAVLSEAG